MDIIKLATDLVKNHEFTFECPKCKSEVKVTLNDDGSAIYCSHCGVLIEVESTVKI